MTRVSTPRALLSILLSIVLVFGFVPLSTAYAATGSGAADNSSGVGNEAASQEVATNASDSASGNTSAGAANAEGTQVLAESAPSSNSTEYNRDVYRLYNPNTGYHHYTLDMNERDVLNGLGWNYEGVSFVMYDASFTGADPVYRAYNPNNGTHNWTLDSNEQTTLVGLGWNDEGIAWRVPPGATVPVYRLYNPTSWEHLYTTDKNEYDALVRVGWSGENVGWVSAGEAPKPVSIEVATEPTTTEYTVGEAFDPRGLSITVTNSDGSQETVNYDPNSTDLLVSAPDMHTAGVKTITVIYGGLTTTFEITVSEDTPTPTPVSIAIATEPTNTEYTVGDTFSAAGLVLNVTDSEGATTQVAYNDETASQFSFEGYDMNTAGTQTVTVTYAGLTTSFEITVSAVAPSLTLNNAEDASVTFTEGDSTAKEIAYTYTGTEEVQVTVSDAAFETAVTSAEGSVSINPTGLSAGDTFTVTLSATDVTDPVVITVTVEAAAEAPSITLSNDEDASVTFTEGDSTAKEIAYTYTGTEEVQVTVSDAAFETAVTSAEGSVSINPTGLSAGDTFTVTLSATDVTDPVVITVTVEAAAV